MSGLIAMVCVGDTLITLVKVIPLDVEEIRAGGATYNLTFTDIPTERRYTKSITEENQAMQALAAWIAADDPEKNLKVGLKTLKLDPAIMKYFMP